MSDLSEFHDELRSVARDVLGAEASWDAVAASGWPGLEVAEELGGAGATFAEVAVVLEEVGRAAAAGPFPAVAALGVGLLGLLEPSDGRDELLRDTASGTAVPVAVLAGEAGSAAAFRAGDAALEGEAAFVLDAGSATRLLVPALDAAGVPVVACVDPAAVDVVAQPVLDETRRFARVTASGVRPDAVWRFAGDPAAALRRLQDRAAVAVACDSLGLAAAMLDATVAYAGVREQFGRKIGSFQAVKHACADMLVRVTVARRLVGAAVRAQGEPGSAEAWVAASVAASMAKAYACAAAVEVAGSAMQLHGGMGYTWESGIHRYLKRAVLDRSLFGSPAAHRRRLAARY